jgi:hypothetical protein
LDFRQIAYQRQIVNISTRASDSWCRCRKRHYAMSIKRLLNVVECGGDIGRRVVAFVLPISNRTRVTSGCAGKIGLREPGEHTSGPDLASRDNVAHNQNLYTILETPPRLTRFIESRPGDMLSDGPCWLACLECYGPSIALDRSWSTKGRSRWRRQKVLNAADHPTNPSRRSRWLRSKRAQGLIG